MNKRILINAQLDNLFSALPITSKSSKGLNALLCTTSEASQRSSVAWHTRRPMGHDSGTTHGPESGQCFSGDMGNLIYTYFHGHRFFVFNVDLKSEFHLLGMVWPTILRNGKLDLDSIIEMIKSGQSLIARRKFVSLTSFI